jgi:hypothetical protein
MQTLWRVVRAFFSTVWGWGGLMSGALLVGPNLYNVYRVAHNRTPISSGLAWAIVQMAGAIAFVVMVARLGYSEHQRAVAAESRASSAEARLDDAGRATRARNQVLAAIADRIESGNALCDQAPRGEATMDEIEEWRVGVNRWIDETRSYLLEHSKSAAARFDHIRGVMAANVPGVNRACNNDCLVIERRLENLHAISEMSDSYLT